MSNIHNLFRLTPQEFDACCLTQLNNVSLGLDEIPFDALARLSLPDGSAYEKLCEVQIRITTAIMGIEDFKRAERMKRERSK